ncbi:MULTISPECIES: aldehyde dehydrogenase family protein [unclassified Agrococcus]|uniref:aldehyde dehydrogenase family protein n=1 Tax=unclassified Agrococcus TaxID=2615065 RepID=UPI0036211D04
MTLTTTDPRTGITTDAGVEPTSPDEVAAITRAAHEAFLVLRARPRAWRASMLRACADALEERRADLMRVAGAETGLGAPRLEGELTRTTTQLRMFADAVEEGSYLEAAIDHAGPTPMGPGPEIRRMLVPLGPVAVFGSSNFPFAFSVPGGDTASALAAGNPVVAKAHSSHPGTSALAFEALAAGVAAVGGPVGTVGIVYGQPAGTALVADPRITAVGFTGSLTTGRILLDVIEGRERPIPFYGELASVNPLVVTPGAVAARGAAIAEGLFASVTGSAGQLCTKPGIAFVPAGAEGDAVVDAVVALARDAAAQPLLNGRIHASFDEIRARLVEEGAARELVAPVAADEGFGMSPAVLEIDAPAVTPAATEEAFGPLVMLVRYRELVEVTAALDAVPDSLTATLHVEDAEVDALAGFATDLADRAGRLVVNGYPTGVRVSWAQHHGGPWPATNTLHTSVGMTAIRRFLRPFAWQDAPEALLPVEVRDADAGIPRRIDGVLTLPSTLSA